MKLPAIKPTFKTGEKSIISESKNAKLLELKNNKLIKNTHNHERKYVLSFDNNYLIRSIIKALGEKGFLSIT